MTRWSWGGWAVGCTLALGWGVVAAEEAAPRFVPDANLERSAIPRLYTWTLDPLFASDAEFALALDRSEAQRRRLASCAESSANPAALADCLDLYFETRLLINKLTLYANLRLDTDEQSAAARALSEQSLRAFDAFMVDSAGLRERLLRLSPARLQAACRREPRLAAYRSYLDDLRRRRSRLLSPETERVLALAGDVLWAELDLSELPGPHERTFDALLSSIRWPTVTDEAGRSVQLTLANYPKLRAAADRCVARETVEKFLATLRAHQDVFAATLGAQVSFNVFLARARGYPTALAAFLERDNVDPAVLHNLISAVRANLQPLQRYLALRQRVLPAPEIRLYDLYRPLSTGVERTIPFAEGVELITAALAPLGPDYRETLRTGLDPRQGWIDVFPHRHKRSGAFCSSVHGVHPFVKVNYQERLDDLSTLAHEYGHALHSHFAMTHQPCMTSNYPPLLAEIASTLNEKLLSDHLLQAARSDAERLYVLEGLAERIRLTVYRQTMFAEFELRLHTAAEQGLPLTAELMNRTYRELLGAYYGPGFTIGSNDEVEWAYIPHFYYKYYTYSYATGLSTGIALAERVRGSAAARDAYLTLLKSGSSRPPLELLEAAGVDLRRPDVIVAAARTLDRTVAEIERLLGR